MSVPPAVSREPDAVRGPDVLAAHARLAAIDPEAPEPLLRGGILDALLKGAGTSVGVLLDPDRPAESPAEGLGARG